MVVPALILRKLPDNKMPSFLYACLSMDSVAATYGLGKTNAIAMARKGYTLDLLGQLVADINMVVKEATLFIAAYYDFNTLCSYMADCCQQQWALRLEHLQQPQSSAVCCLQQLISISVPHITKDIVFSVEMPLP